MSSIDELKYNFDSGARGNRFDVNFFLPGAYFGKTKQTIEAKTDETTGESYKAVDEMVTSPGRVMGLRVESCSLPGRSIGTTGWSEQGMERQMPDGTVNDGGTIDFTFICDQSFADRLIIEAWQQVIFTAGNNKQAVPAQEATDAAEAQDAIDGSIKGTNFMPQMAFYKDYIGRVEIIQHRTDRKDSEDTKRNALEYTLHEAYPVSFSEMGLSQDANGIMRFSCTLAYRYWESKYIPAPKRSLLNKGRGLLDALLGGSNLLSRFGKEGKLRDRLTNLDNRATEIRNLFG